VVGAELPGNIVLPAYEAVDGGSWLGAAFTGSRPQDAHRRETRAFHVRLRGQNIACSTARAFGAFTELGSRSLIGLSGTVRYNG